MKRNREYTCSRTEEQVKYQCYSDSHDQKNVVLSVIKHIFSCTYGFRPALIRFHIFRIRSGFFADPDPDSGKKSDP